MTNGSVAAPQPQQPVYLPPPRATSFPGRVLGIVGFVLSFITPLNVAGLVLCIIAMVQSKRVGHNNGLALAGIIIAGVGILFSIPIVWFIAPPLIHVAQTCARLGDGVHEIGNTTYTCTPTSFSVTTHN